MIHSTPVQGHNFELLAALSAAGLPIEDLEEEGRSFFQFEEDGVPIGFGGFEPYGEDTLVRSIVVMPEFRGTGAGRRITEALLEEAEKAGARTAYLLTTTASGFFARLGFSAEDRSQAPASILATRQAASICSTAALLCRPIKAPDVHL